MSKRSGNLNSSMNSIGRFDLGDVFLKRCSSTSEKFKVRLGVTRLKGHTIGMLPLPIHSLQSGYRYLPYMPKMILYSPNAIWPKTIVDSCRLPPTRHFHETSSNRRHMGFCAQPHWEATLAGSRLEVAAGLLEL